MLDHGELNIPGRTNGINAQIDRHKREQDAGRALKAKSDAMARKTDRARAQELFAEVGDAIISKHGPRLGAAALREMLVSQVKWEPASFIRTAEAFIRERGSA